MDLVWVGVHARVTRYTGNSEWIVHLTSPLTSSQCRALD